MRASSMPSSPARTRRLKCGTFVAPQIVSRPSAASGSATRPRVSSGTPVWRPTSTSISTTRSAPLERRGDVAVAAREREDLVAGAVERRGVALDRARRVEDDVERLELRVDELRRVLGGVRVVGHDDRDGLADVAHGAVGEDGLEEGVERLVEGPEADRDPRHRVEVGGGQHGVDAGRRARRGRVDADEPRVRRRRAHDAHPDLARAVDVVDEPAGAAQQAGVLDAPDRPADRRHGAAASAAPSAAARTASRIDW